MNQTVIPAVNAEDFDTIEALIVSAHKFLPPDGWIHIDVTDGKFTANQTWDNPAELSRFIAGSPEYSSLKFEIHLMVLDPESEVRRWLKAGASRVIVHAEALHDAHIVLEQCERYGAGAMVSINPETPVEQLSAYLNQFELFQVLAVKPGLAGQQFKPDVLDKIKFLRARAPNAKIEVDGGINPETAKLCVQAGADILVSASYIFGNPNPKQAYEELVRVTSNFN